MAPSSRHRVQRGARWNPSPPPGQPPAQPLATAYFFTSSTSFANPAVTIGREFSDTFAGIAPTSVLPFILAQLLGAAIGAAQTELFHPRPGVIPEPLDLPGPVHDRP